MFAQERRDVILQVLHQDGTVLVKDLSERFAVTEDCIRKDLAFLENQGFLKRTYGEMCIRDRSLRAICRIWR